MMLSKGDGSVKGFGVADGGWEFIDLFLGGIEKCWQKQNYRSFRLWSYNSPLELKAKALEIIA